MPAWPGFIGPSYESLSRMLNGELTMNFIPQIVGAEAPNAKAQRWLYQIPGVLDFGAMSAGPGRALFREDSGRVFAVGGNRFGEFSRAGAWTPLGNVTLDANPAQVLSNGNGQLLVRSGNTGYVFDLGTSAFTVELSGITVAQAMDTFFLALDAATGELKISEAGDGTTWDPTQVVLRSAMPDPWIAMTVAAKEIILIGGKSGEAWFNNGGSPFPFALRAGSVFDLGIEATFSLVPFAGSVAWLGSGEHGPLGVYALNGYNPYKISSLALDWALQQYRDQTGVSDAIGWTYDRLGHSFYVLDLPSVGKSWVYDKTTDQWHQRGLWSAINNDFLHYRPRYYIDAFGYGLVLDGEGASVYRFSEDTFTDVGGSVLRCVRRSPMLRTENRRIAIDYLEFDAQRGVGLQAGQGSDPELMVRMSWNSGGSWGNERRVSLGRVGEYDAPLRIPKWGSGRSPLVEVACSDPVPVRLFNLYFGAS